HFFPDGQLREIKLPMVVVKVSQQRARVGCCAAGALQFGRECRDVIVGHCRHRTKFKPRSENAKCKMQSANPKSSSATMLDFHFDFAYAFVSMRSSPSPP